MAADRPLPDVEIIGTFNENGVTPCRSDNSGSNQDARLPANLQERMASLDLPDHGLPHGGTHAISETGFLEQAHDSMPASTQLQTEWVQHDDSTPFYAKGKAPETISDGIDLIGPSTAHPSHITIEKRKKTRPIIDYNDPDCVYEPPESASSIDDFQDTNCLPGSDIQLTSSSSSLCEDTIHGLPLTDTDSAADSPALTQAPLSAKQKGKQKATEIDLEVDAADAVTETSGEDTTLPFRPLNVGDPGWERSAGRPQQKLPIRFKDAVGRNFVFPWERARQWKDMEQLIQQCFLHVDIIGPHVQAGHYDLLADLPYETQTRLTSISSAGSSTAHTSASNATASTDSSTGATASSAAAAESSSASANANNTASSSQPKPSNFIILPALWEDTIEPGMLVSQHMWPMMQPSPPTVQMHYYPPGLSRGRGRGTMAGRGRGVSLNGMGMGRGGPPMPPGPHIIDLMPRARPLKTPMPRGKTRRRTEGL